jgi:acyl-coenzyme A synthetase/AMP-(fatty) acid ligase
MYILVQAEFICGEYGQMFCHAFHISQPHKMDADDTVTDYFKNYYEDPDLCEVVENGYLYHHGQVLVKVQGTRKITKEEYDVLHKFNI